MKGRRGPTGRRDLERDWRGDVYILFVATYKFRIADRGFVFFSFVIMAS